MERARAAYTSWPGGWSTAVAAAGRAGGGRPRRVGLRRRSAGRRAPSGGRAARARRPVPAASGSPRVGAAGTRGRAAAETSTRTVQGLLFVLGGLLLGTAAVVFTAVAWAAVGVGGRALILAAFTALALAVPLVAVRRGLRGTAETFAAVGLLLVVLDGYAAWSVDLVGVAGWPGSPVRRAGRGGQRGGRRRVRPVERADRAVVRGAGWPPSRCCRCSPADGRARCGRLGAGPARGGAAEPGGAGRAARPGRRPGARLVGRAVLGRDRSRRALLVGAAAARWCRWSVGRAAGSPLLAGVPLLLVALTGFGAAWLAAGGRFGRVAAGLLVPVLAARAAAPGGASCGRRCCCSRRRRWSARRWPAAVRLLPGAGWRTGPRAGALLVAAGSAQVAVLLAVVVGGAAAGRSLPPWQGAGTGRTCGWGWQLPLAVALAVGAMALLLPRGARAALAAAGAVAVLLAVPAGWTARLAAVLAVDLAGGVALLLAVAGPARRPGLAVLLTAARSAVPSCSGTRCWWPGRPGRGRWWCSASVAGGRRWRWPVRPAAPGRTGGSPGRAGRGAARAARPSRWWRCSPPGAPPWWQARVALAAAGLPLVAAARGASPPGRT